jgi:hypothetical protein
LGGKACAVSLPFGDIILAQQAFLFPSGITKPFSPKTLVELQFLIVFLSKL